MRAPVALRPPLGVPLRAPIHPGCFLQRHFLAPLAWSQSEAARHLGVSRRRLHELVHGQRALTPDTALRCAQLFAWPADQALALQARFDAFAAWQQARHPGGVSRRGSAHLDAAAAARPSSVQPFSR